MPWIHQRRQALQIATTPGSSRPGCADLTCSAHPMTRTPFRASAATFKSGRLCFTVDTDRAGKFSAACNNSPGARLRVATRISWSLFHRGHGLGGEVQWGLRQLARSGPGLLLGFVRVGLIRSDSGLRVIITMRIR